MNRANNTVQSKKNVAIIIPGGVGTGHNNIGVPVLERIIRLLSRDFNITVFQLYTINAGYKAEEFELIETYSSNPILRGLKFFFTFWKMQRRKKFSCVHGFWLLPNGFFAVLMGKLFGIKSIVSVLGGDAISMPEIQYGQLRNPLYRKLILWTLHQADEINALTRYLIENLKKTGFKRSDYKIIPWGIDTVLFQYTEKPLQQPVQFLHIGNLHPVKDQETLLRAFKLINHKISSRLTIIGVGIDEKKVRSLITDLGISDHVVLQGLLPYEALPLYYRSSDVLLHTSRSEGQSEVVTEAMSCGVLVCGTRVGLLYDIPNSCIAVPVRDHNLLAEEVLQLLDDPDRIKAIRQRALSWTTEHSIQWTAEKIKEIYNS